MIVEFGAFFTKLCRPGSRGQYSISAKFFGPLPAKIMPPPGPGTPKLCPPPPVRKYPF